MTGGRPRYERALAALQEAHDACLNHPDRGPIGMSCGPFSGVNTALGIIAMLEQENNAMAAAVARLFATLEAIAAMPDEVDEWDGADKFSQARSMAETAIRNGLHEK